MKKSGTIKKAVTEYKFIDWRREKKLPTSTEICLASLPYVKWGPKNDYPLLLNTLYEKSPSQTGIINGKTYYMTAGGYTITPTVTSQEVATKIAAFEANGVSDYSLQDVIIACVKDYELYNGWCFRGVWNPITGLPSFIEPLDFDCIRTNEEGNRYYYSEDWTSNIQSEEKTGFREIPEYNIESKVGEFIIYISGAKKKTEKGYVKVYPSAPYSGCIESLATEIEMQSFHFYETQNGFKAGTVLHLPSAKPKSQGERTLLANKIKKEGTDRESSGGIIVLFGEGGTDKPTVLQLNGNDLDKRYTQLETSTANTILRAHSIGTPSLFGMVVAGQLGNTQEIQNGFEILKKTYVQARQKSFNDTFSWYIKSILGIPASFSLNPPPPILGGGDTEDETLKAIASLSPLVANKVLDKMTDNEVRKLGKLPPVAGGDVINSPTAPTFKIDTNRFTYTDDEERTVLRSLARCGRKKFRYIVKESRRVPVDFTDDWFETSEKELLDSVLKDKLFFATILTEIQKNVLSLIDDGQDVNSIARALDTSIQKVMDAYNELSNKGLIKKNGELSTIGKRYLDVTEIPADNFEIRYSYELRPDAPKLSKNGIGESRPFCKKLMQLDRLYTRAEIDQISAAVGRNVFNFKGGWYSNPETKQRTPFCRHTWLQQIVIKKK